MACVTTPASTSEIFSRPAKTERPAASPDVHPSGRSLLDARSHEAPLAALHGGVVPPTVAQVSQSVHASVQAAPCCNASRWSSPCVLPAAGAPSILGVSGIG